MIVELNQWIKKKYFCGKYKPVWQNMSNNYLRNIYAKKKFIQKEKIIRVSLYEEGGREEVCKVNH